MTKFKGAAILGALMIAGLTLFSSLAKSGTFPDLTTEVARRLATTCPRGENRPLCRFVAGIVQYLDEEDFFDAKKALLRLEPAVRLGPGERNCDGCIQAVSDIEAFLATNGTAADFQSMILDGCDRFRTPEQVAECEALAGLVPQGIDRFLAVLPPSIACSSGNRRPFIYCREQ
jgi:hypothetical protein